ncbi:MULTISPECIES: DUF1837 domain-containing protein [unclassified Pseudomonas]|uniref:HamA C-terminal domain-containing protein n=1 Tax=unclassified Pseudomonas TaxID=196821 RepID=UPI000DA77064|nr:MULTISPECIES: DUF1837 domain-containing protein [unclassified Pseudomonas]MDW3711384.1 DUF1837 domain-containing protein [Pseudomonas sp. 2023EL-01195]PZE12854.1 DUF1837 domain-containing protein [Pseudomonas sp. 57B-090624]
MPISFEVLIDELFLTFVPESEIQPAHNKNVLCMINHFEDGKWMFKKFQNFIWDNIGETSLSFKERASLVNHSLLTEAAKNLRLTDKDGDISEGSELAEIVLYGIMKHQYGALPVVPKIFHKQNSQDTAKGADSVHITIKDGDYSLWFGEAKFYNSIEDARLPEIIKSVENSLNTNKLKKENSIILNTKDLESVVQDESILRKIQTALSPQESIDPLKSKINIPILLLHECQITKNQTTLTTEYKKEILTYHQNRASAYFSKQAKKIGSIHKYSEIKFHLILFPVPSKEEIVKKFLANVEHYKDQ